ncbi:MAG TPA: hypothetical protein VK395_07020, partial [Gemmataceae bacterium]|nr:hypothetical protein [Gemmataceae bacterium]
MISINLFQFTECLLIYVSEEESKRKNNRVRESFLPDSFCIREAAAAFFLKPFPSSAFILPTGRE